MDVNMVADMEVDMVADMEVNKVADLVADKKTHSVSKVQENVIFSKSRGIKDVNNDGLRMTIFTCPSSLSPISSSWAILKQFVLAIVHISVTIMYHFVLG